MQTFYGDLFHLIRNCVIAIASKPVRLHTHDKVRAQVVGQAVKFENIALAIADVDAAIWFAEKTNRLPTMQIRNALVLSHKARQARRLPGAIKRSPARKHGHLARTFLHRTLTPLTFWPSFQIIPRTKAPNCSVELEGEPTAGVTT
jgi:hypothetical protein